MNSNNSRLPERSRRRGVSGWVMKKAIHFFEFHDSIDALIIV